MHRDGHAHGQHADLDDDHPLLRDRAARRGLRGRLGLRPRNPQQPAALRDGRGSNSCPGGAQRTDWYTSYTGNFACNPCSCGQPSGASCAGSRIIVGSNGACDNQMQVLGSGQSYCSPTGIPNPAIVSTGVPTAPTCVPMNSGSGALTPAGPQTVCCR